MNEEFVATEKKADYKINYFTLPGGEIITKINKSNGFSDYGPVYFIKNIFQEIFLPQGYPQSVSSDYLDYQIWDTIQAFCSTINGTLTTHAIFQGVGVGDSEATALAATITWVMKDGTGMVGRIGFAWWKGFLLDTECKKWRLAADIINDGAMFIELLLGTLFFKNYSSIILCLATIMKTIVGVAGGATRAAITQHQAIRGNMGDVSAKDGSQETCVNLIASLFAVIILKQIENNSWNIWCLFFLSTIFHLYANYKAIKSLNIKTLNNSRFILIMKHFLRFNEVGIPKYINNKESIFLGYGITDEELCSKKIYLGYSLKKFMKDNPNFDANALKNLKLIYNEFPYIILIDESIKIVLHENISEKDLIMSYYHGLVLGIVIKYSIIPEFKIPNNEFRYLIEECKKTKSVEKVVSQFVQENWKNFAHRLNLNGWILNRHQLLTEEWRIKWH